MFRTCGVAFACAVAACASPKPPAAAPTPTQPRTSTSTPLMPLATGLQAIPLGSWAEYHEIFLGFTTTTRVTALAKTSETITIETTRTGGLLQADRLRWTYTFAVGRDDGRLLRSAFQVNAGAPDEKLVAESMYLRLDPKTLIGTEVITVRGGTFTAGHYRYESRDGDPVDAWVADGLWPIGLVRLTVEIAPGPPPVLYTIELVGRSAGPSP